MTATFGPALRNHSFRWLWLGQSASTVGDQLSLVAIAGLVIDAGHGASGLGLVLAGRSLALVLFLVPGGIIGDRLKRTRVMIGADTFRVVVTATLALSPGDTPVLALAALTFLVGAGEAFFQPAYRALLPSVLPDRHLEAGNALTALSRQTAAIAGPALAGVLIAVGSPRTALLVNALTFLASLATLAAIAEPPRSRDREERRSTIRQDVREGLSVLTERPWIGLGIAMAGVQLLLTLAPWMVLLPVIAADDLGGTDVYGWLLALTAAGSILGSLLSARWKPHLPGVVALIALLPSGLVLLTLVGPAPLALIAVGVLVTGLGEALFDVYWTSGIQRDVPGRYLARIFSLDYVGSLALMPVGYALIGPAVNLLGQDTVLVVGAIATVLTTLPLLALPSMRRFSSRGAHPAGVDPSTATTDTPV